MKRNIIKILMISIFMLLIYMPFCYAAGATTSANAVEAKPGDKVKLYIDLTTASIGYDIKVSINDENLISSAKLVDNIGSGNESRMYLVQLVGADERVTYPVGTRIATIEYQISDTAAVGSQLTINITGDIAGENSEDKNTMNESIVINIVESIVNNNEINKGQEQEPVVPDDENDVVQTPENNGEEQEVVQSGSYLEEETFQNQQEKDETTSGEKLPKTGIPNLILLLSILAFAMLVMSAIKVYNNRDIK